MNEFVKYYFVGIGGIGMSALALYLREKGFDVAGYDAVSSNVTKRLQEKGIEIHFEDNPDLIPQNFKDKQQTLVVYTPAIPDEHKELAYFRDNGFEIVKRADLLAEITKDKKTIAIAGTHGKTTITAITAYLFDKSERLNAAFVGGIMKNYGSNYIAGGVGYGWTITEADEFDRSFLKLNPYSAVISTIEPDHLDIYSDKNDIVQAFKEFAKKTENVIVINDKVDLDLKGKSHVFKYGFSPDADFRAVNVRIENAKQVFDIEYVDGVLKDVKINLPGTVNVENALAAFAIAFLSGIDENEMKKALAEFQGVERRFDTLYKSDRYVYINDYAHHPTEIESLREAVKQFYPGKKITAIFQPHLYTRTRDFADDFAKVLQKFDDVVLTDIYPARQKPLPGVTSEIILEKIKSNNKQYCEYDKIIDIVERKKPEVLLTIGAGDIDNLSGRIVETFKQIDEN